MGLDQWILKGKDGVEPYIDDDGEWRNSIEIIQLRKEYWLHNRIISIGQKKLLKPYELLNCEYIPLTKEELEIMLKDSKECVKVKSSFLIDAYFGEYPIGDYELDCVLEGMKQFNKRIGNALKSKTNEYYYYSWW